MTEQLNFFNKLKLLNNELLNDTLTSQQVLDIVNQLLQLDNKISNIEIEIKQLNVKNFKLYSKYNPTLSVDVDELDITKLPVPADVTLKGIPKLVTSTVRVQPLLIIDKHICSGIIAGSCRGE
jgi:hypothetical protein